MALNKSASAFKLRDNSSLLQPPERASNGSDRSTLTPKARSPENEYDAYNDYMVKRVSVPLINDRLNSASVQNRSRLGAQ